MEQGKVESMSEKRKIQCDVALTPEIAAKWLATRGRQRPLNALQVAAYADEMLAGSGASQTASSCLMRWGT